MSDTLSDIIFSTDVCTSPDHPHNAPDSNHLTVAELDQQHVQLQEQKQHLQVEN